MSLYCNKQSGLKKIIVSVTNDLTSDQRVDKVCNTLHNGGYEVLLIGKKKQKQQSISQKLRNKKIQPIFSKGGFVLC